MTETIALHGTKELLQQARKDLVAAGFMDDERWNTRVINDDSYAIDHLFVYTNTVIKYHNHAYTTNTVINLTTENLTTVIELLKQQLCTTNLSNPTASTSTQ